MSPIPPHTPGGGGGNVSIFGLLVDRPAAGSVDSGTIYVATDTGSEFISDGVVNWYTIDIQTLFGNFADRPPAATMESGSIYVAVDTDEEYISDGSQWYQLGSPAAPPFYGVGTIALLADYSVQANDPLILLNGPSLTLDLPSVLSGINAPVIIKDRGHATGTSHTIQPFPGEFIDGQSLAYIDTDWDGLMLVPNPGNQEWVVI